MFYRAILSIPKNPFTFSIFLLPSCFLIYTLNKTFPPKKGKKPIKEEGELMSESGGGKLRPISIPDLGV